MSISTRGGLSTFFELSENCENSQVLQRIEKDKSETQWSKRYNEVDCLDRIFQTFRKVQLLRKIKK